jgi:hypothetical protein
MRGIGMDEINDLGKYLRLSKESLEAKYPMPPKGGNIILSPWLMAEAFVFIVFVMSLVGFARRATSDGVSLGMSLAMYLVTRAAAFAGILAFLHFGVRACLTIYDSSRGFVQLIGCWALTLTVVALTLAALMLLIFFSFADY